MSLLDTLIYGYRTVYSAAVEITRRNKINFVGGISAVDNPTTGMTDVGGFADAITPAALEVDWSAGAVFEKTLAAGANAITFANAQDGQMITFVVTGAASTATWPDVDEWPSGAVPTQTASGTDVYTFVKTGGIVRGIVAPDFS